MVQLLGTLAAIGVGVYFVYMAIIGIAGSISGFGILLVVGIPIAFYVVYKMVANAKAINAFDALPDTGPMRVDLRMEEIPASRAFRLISGSKIAHRMHITFTISKKDKVAFQNSGLFLNELFARRHPNDPEHMVSFIGPHLFNTPYVDFPTLQELDAAKAQLADSLYAIRTHLEGQQHRPKHETIEA